MTPCHLISDTNDAPSFVKYGAPMPRADVPTSLKRAVTVDQKRERRRTILKTAEVHLKAVGFENFSMEVLARKLGIARGTLYRYFATREELLLAIYEQDREAWSTDLIEAVTPGMRDPDFVQCFLDQTRAHPVFLDLSARLESVIEHNVSIERLLESKQLMHALMSRLSRHLAACLNLPRSEAAHVVISLGTLLLGAAQIDSGPSLGDVDWPPEIHEMMDAFSSTDIFRSNAELILEGLRRRNQSSPTPAA